MTIGKAIEFCRTRREMDLSDVAVLARLSESYLSLLENGKRTPKFSTIQKIAAALDVPMIILTFLAERDEIHRINPELAEKLSSEALQLTGSPTRKCGKLPK